MRLKTLDRQIISPRAFALLGLLIIALLAFGASRAHADECPNHCTEERIDYYHSLHNGDLPKNTVPRVAGPPEYQNPKLIEALRGAVLSVNYPCRVAAIVSITQYYSWKTYWLSCEDNSRQYSIITTQYEVLIFHGFHTDPLN